MSQINAGLLLLRPQGDRNLIAGTGRTPLVIPVAIDETCREAVHVTRRLETEVGGRLFLRQVISVPGLGGDRRLFVAEAQDAPVTQRTWIPTDEHRADLARALRTALAGEEGHERTYESVVEQALDMVQLPWCRPGWLGELRRRLDAHFAEPTDVQPYKLRVGRLILRVANSGGMYEVHATAPADADANRWAHNTLHDAEQRGLLRGCRPDLAGSFPDLGAEVRQAPIGTSLAMLGDLPTWSAAMQSMVELQIRSSMRGGLTGAAPYGGGALASRLEDCVQQWQAHEVLGEGFGTRSLKWIKDCVLDAIEMLDASVLPPVIVNGAMTGFTTYASDGRIQISEWHPTYIGHPFTALARPLSHRAGALARHTQADLARPFVAGWLRFGRPADLSQEVKAGIVVGSAVQAISAWETGRTFAASAAPALGEQITEWCETILRRSTG
ncbi:hypothetical protein ABZ397_08100 [Streptomyces sp. NPDC005876]|uniref:hypothetical protein n=1 Tax=Streptomyces sp. NPDC005876 TaxID=3157076 RepID=UPI0033ECD4C5